MSTRQRRRAIVAGVTATAPIAWASPIVQSVILPAHAQTSTATDCSGPPFALDNISIACDTRNGTRIAFGVDDQGACPELVMDPPDDFPGHEVVVVTYASGDQSDPGNTISLRVNNVDVSGTEYSLGLYCEDDRTDGQGSLPVMFNAASGAAWRIDGNAAAQNGAITFDSIEITPAS